MELAFNRRWRGSGLCEVRCAAASGVRRLQRNTLTAHSIFIGVAARASFAEEFPTIKATLKLKVPVIVTSSAFDPEQRTLHFLSAKQRENEHYFYSLWYGYMVGMS